MSSDKHEASNLFCDVCSAHIPNETTFQQHLNGRKHTRNVERIKEWSDAAKRSIYVGGLKNIVAVELAIADYFGQFGKVKNITIDKTFKQYAIVELESEQMAHTVLAIENPLLNGIPVVIKARELKDGKHVNASKEKSHQKQSPIDEKLWQKLLDCKDLDDQILMLHDEVKLSEEELHVRDLICKLLQSALHEAFPDCTLKPYGSSVSGFGTQGCDLDLHFEYTSIHPDILHEIKMHRDTENDSSNSTVGEEITSQEIIAAVGEVIKQCVPDCHKIKVISASRFPLVRFYHKGSNVKCDISLSNKLAVVNTTYLQLCCKVFPMLKPLVIAIRTWMRHWELAGGVHVNGPRLNNYAVTLMALFFLQNTGRMPSLKAMVASVSDTPVLIDGFDCTLVETYPVCEPKGSLGDLLADFFQFYSKVEFSKAVLNARSACYQTAQTEKEENPTGRKFKYGSLNVQDPFEVSHNVTGNVTERHMQNFYRQMHNAALVVKMRKYQHRAMHVSCWGILALFIDHHKKQGDSEASVPNPAKSNAYAFDVKLKPDASEMHQGDLPKAGGYLVNILCDVFAMDCQVVDAEIITNAPMTESAQVAVAMETFPIKAKEELHKHEVATKKRPADSEDCTFCKRAKVALDRSDATTHPINLPCQLKCVAKQRLWQGRRKARRRLVQKGKADFLDLERKVSQLLLSDLVNDSTHGGSMQQQLNTSCSSTDSCGPPLFSFTTDVKQLNETALRLLFRCTSDDGHSDYVNFVHHLEMFLPNLLKKCVAKSDDGGQ
uniref:Speckle targeted PIP5K1A-regulated poly(A) polymerase n=1 Tax=Phallusia mammillata TaxID=59560 RepID=A0A6F9DVC9_9ASCI|nr:speckle targeted PIP5K1A-regulated poly(A) polymerase-like [Phallusia mammillata]